MIRSAFAILAASFLLTACVTPPGDTLAEKRQAAQNMRSETLADLYNVHPIAREQISKAVGHGVFSNVGLKVFLVSAESGWGVVRDQLRGGDTYMKMAAGGVGFGLGVKDFRGVFVFTSQQAMDNFVNKGWDASASADAAAKAGDKGGAWAGAIDVAPGIKLYQLTKNGLALQATIQGTKYWKDKELN